VGEPCHDGKRKLKKDCFVAVIMADCSYNLSALENMLNRCASKKHTLAAI
jgi:hypothetical protein